MKLGRKGGGGHQCIISSMATYLMLSSLPRNIYINLTNEGPEEILFDPPKALACQRVAMQPIYGTEAENRIGGSNEEGNMPILP